MWLGIVYLSWGNTNLNIDQRSQDRIVSARQLHDLAWRKGLGLNSVGTGKVCNVSAFIDIRN